MKDKPVKESRENPPQDVDKQFPSERQQQDKEHGEGNYKAAREYDRATEQFARSGKVGPAARAAQPRSKQEAEEMERAEAAGKSRSKGEDPAASR